jgi:hypothetical protein
LIHALGLEEAAAKHKGWVEITPLDYCSGMHEWDGRIGKAWEINGIDGMELGWEGMAGSITGRHPRNFFYTRHYTYSTLISRSQSRHFGIPTATDGVFGWAMAF